MAKKNKENRKKRFLYYDETDFQYDLMYSQSYYEKDVNFTMTLHRIDIVKNKSQGGLYNEVRGEKKILLPPIEIVVALDFGKSERGYTTTQLAYESSNLKFGIYLNELQKKNIDVKRGDYVVYNDNSFKRGYEIQNVTNINSARSFYGYENYYKMVTATLVNDDKFLLERDNRPIELK